MDEGGKRMIKLLYKPASMMVSLAGGMLASAIFKRVWKLTAGEDEAPEATDAAKGWPEILIAAALQGASSPWSGAGGGSPRQAPGR